MAFLIEAIGWLGAVCVLAAYGLVSTGKADARSTVYQMLNIGGALGLVVNAWWNGAIPSAIVNVIWIGIGVYAVLKARRTPTA